MRYWCEEMVLERSIKMSFDIIGNGKSINNGSLNLSPKQARVATITLPVVWRNASPCWLLWLWVSYLHLYTINLLNYFNNTFRSNVYSFLGADAVKSERFQRQAVDQNATNAENTTLSPYQMTTVINQSVTSGGSLSTETSGPGAESAKRVEQKCGHAQNCRYLC